MKKYDKFKTEKLFRDYFIKSCKAVDKILFVLREESNMGQPDINITLKNGKKISVELKIHRVNKLYNHQKEILKIKNHYLLINKCDSFILKSSDKEIINSKNIYEIIKILIK